MNTHFGTQADEGAHDRGLRREAQQAVEERDFQQGHTPEPAHQRDHLGGAAEPLSFRQLALGQRPRRARTGEEGRIGEVRHSDNAQ